ncbi:hypothetical protein DPMN_004380 [Dreissena polymorpha]|uniref:Uncharacterized protein n=1 Tax=Dreissena polymorpha TaxID=45954 RepID=A0A9D4MRM8_DREPO|nr:hypothetical protein DPMN_004380 [Dreissena polymorpha]
MVTSAVSVPPPSSSDTLTFNEYEGLVSLSSVPERIIFPLLESKRNLFPVFPDIIEYVNFPYLLVARSGSVATTVTTTSPIEDVLSVMLAAYGSSWN